MNIAIIPARGGSKRIKSKNIRSFYSKPIIYWPINIAIQSKLFDKVIVSTDDKNIANLANQFGADTPYIRPKELADDFTGTIEVIKHAIEWAIESNLDVESVCCIYPTSVFLTAKVLKLANKVIQEKKWKYVVSVTDFDYPIQKALKITDSGGLEMNDPDFFKTRTQDLARNVHDAAQFYWGPKDSWLNGEHFFQNESYPIEIDRNKVYDIDNEKDWFIAENMFKIINNERE